ncbi:MAG: 3-deoxy-7-phosphoheptulonate synthase [Eubacteriales bacterium]
MIIVMKPNTEEKHLNDIVQELRDLGMQVQINAGVECYVLGVIGDTASLDRDALSMREGVDRIMSVSEPFKKSNRKFHPEDTVVKVGDLSIGGGSLTVMAGPCSVESREQINLIADAVKTSGAQFIRGGAYKPRTSPYSFQGLKREGLKLLCEVRERTGMPIVSEIISPRHIDMFEEYVDIIQIGARNMQNFDLLKEIGKTRKPILLKRGMSSTIQEWLMSAEYVMSRGNSNVILCERGIRTFETYTRNTLDLSAIVAVKKLSHLPIIVDPSHATGRRDMIEPMALAAVAAGADGIEVEVHNNPAKALSDGPQSLTPEEFDKMMVKVKKMAELVGKIL